MNKPQVIYKGQLAKEWVDWVEAKNPKGSREKDIYPLLKKWFGDNKPKIVADIGCGQGIISTIVGPETEYVGIDLSNDLIKRAKELYSTPNKKFLVGDAYNIPLFENYCDCAISIWVWSHLSDLEKAAAEMSRILKPGGKFLVISANPDTYDIRKTFYKSYNEFEGYLIGTFDLGDGKTLTNSTLYFHKRKTMLGAIKSAKLTIDRTEIIGLKEEYPGGLNILFEGHKP